MSSLPSRPSSHELPTYRSPLSCPPTAAHQAAYLPQSVARLQVDPSRCADASELRRNWRGLIAYMHALWAVVSQAESPCDCHVIAMRLLCDCHVMAM